MSHPNKTSLVMIRKFAPIALALCSAVAAPAALAQSAGSWTLGIGAHSVNPTAESGNIIANSVPIDVQSSVRPTITAEYFIRDNLGIEVLASWPFEHDINVTGLGRVGTTKHLPPTVSLQYHFNGDGRVAPFVGAGVNYTKFFSETTRGALAGSDLSLRGSWGAALHAGLDFKVSEKAAVRVDARWIDIDTRVRLDGAELGTANIDPLVYGVAYVLKF